MAKWGKSHENGQNQSFPHSFRVLSIKHWKEQRKFWRNMGYNGIMTPDIKAAPSWPLAGTNVLPLGWLLGRTGGCHCCWVANNSARSGGLPYLLWPAGGQVAMARNAHTRLQTFYLTERGNTCRKGCCPIDWPIACQLLTKQRTPSKSSDTSKVSARNWSMSAI